MVIIKKNQLIICSSKFEITDLEEIKILPLGEVKTTKGNFYVDEQSVNAMKEYFKRRGLDIVVDYEHQSLSDKKALAGGWIKDFYIKDNCVVAKVEFTDVAKQEIENKQYKYLSPTVFLKNGKPIRLHSVALTNTPAIDNMYPLFLSEDLKIELEGDDIKMDIKKILDFLGLNENATEEEVIKKIEELKDNEIAKENLNNEIQLSSNKEVISILGLKENATNEEINNALLNLKNNTVSKTEFLALKEEMAKKEINNILDEALKIGKIVPAQRDSFMKLALSDRNTFDEIMKNQKIVSPIGVTYSDKLTEEGKKELEGIELQACKDFGLTEEDYKKYYRKED
ncbi:phage protease [[Clostridium] colinum]|uniref:phage protease n=1 Tax=[Clostridium] colinum TaxID=36835 RepID=UPI0020244F68|nr:phage protease [[Clostridium] colinum]